MLPRPWALLSCHTALISLCFLAPCHADQVYDVAASAEVQRAPSPAAWTGHCRAAPGTGYSEENRGNVTSACKNTRRVAQSMPGKVVRRGNRPFLSITDSNRDHLNSPVARILVPTLYTLVFLVGLPSNGLAFWILATKLKKKMPSTIFLVNLAAADLLLIAVLPFKISYYFLGSHWVFGEAMCRIVTTFFYGNMYCSVLLLMSISVDRYLAVVHPFFSRSFRSKTFAVCLCLVVWLIALFATLPMTIFQQSYDLDHSNRTLCHDGLPRHDLSEYFFYHFICLITLCFLVPLLVILFSYISVVKVLMINGEKYSHAIKLTALSLVITVVFLTPSNVVLLIHYSERGLNQFGDLYIIYMVCLAVSTFNNCIDPFVYYYVSEEFRQKVRQGIWKCSKKTVTSSQTSKEVLPNTTCSTTTQSIV